MLWESFYFVFGGVSMAKISPKIHFRDEDKLSKINKETLSLWKKYEVDMSLRELSVKTIAGYRNDMEHFWLYCYDNYDNVSITAVTEDVIEDFLFFCKTQGNNSRRIKRRLSTLSAFYIFLRRKKLITENPVEFIERAKKDVDVIVQTYLTQEQIDDMQSKLESLIESATTPLQKHANLMLLVYAMFSLSTMARVTAISNTKWEQIDFDQRIVEGVIEKEGYVVDLLFSDKVKELLLRLKKFREDHSINDAGYLFFYTQNEETASVTTSTLNQWCKKIGDLIDVPTLHPHDFRHSGSQLCKLNGMSLEDISDALNHKGTEVTRKHYLKADKTKQRESRDKFGM